MLRALLITMGLILLGISLLWFGIVLVIRNDLLVWEQGWPLFNSLLQFVIILGAMTGAIIVARNVTRI